jgi:hypothetical protein
MPERKRGRGTEKEKELSHMYCSTDIINLIKSGKMRCVIHVTRTGEINESAFKFKL